MSDMTQNRLGRRIRALRDQRKLTQEQLCHAIGLPDRQIVASIEAGTRQISAKELVALARVFEIRLEDILDPYRLLAGEAAFSFRVAPDVNDRDVLDFQFRAGTWIATYRELSRKAGLPPVRIGTKLELDVRSSFEEVELAAEALLDQWNLGDIPAARLQTSIEQELGALVLQVDAPDGLSGAASYMAGLGAIFINRNESRGRRNFDLAHELFHLLTWDSMPPKALEPVEPTRKKGSRIEQLANNFAAALLMPAQSLDALWDRTLKYGFGERVRSLAERFLVSPKAMRYRLHNLGLLVGRAFLEPVPDGPVTPEARPSLFSEMFIARIGAAVAEGVLSARKAASILGVTLGAFAQLCETYGHPLMADA